MTVSIVYGLNNITSEDKAARYHEAAGIVGYKYGVSDGGFVATPGSSARQVSVSPGTAVIYGSLVVSDAVETVTLDAGGASARTDYIVLRRTLGVGASASVAVIKGTSTTPPPLESTSTTQDMPIARVTVPASHSGVFTTAHIQKCAPQPYKAIPKSASSFTDRNADASNPPLSVATLTFDDPGWPYRVQFNAAMTFEASGSGGYGVVVVRYGSTDIGRARTGPRLEGAGQVFANLSRYNQTVRTGPATVSMLVTAGGATDNILTDHTSSFNAFDVVLTPA